MNKILFIIFFHFSVLHAQEIPVSIQQQTEQRAETGDVSDDDDVLQQLDFLLRHPIQLNKASREDFFQFPLLNDWQITNFLSYRKLAGKLIDLHELQAVPGWDVALIQ
jgi:hypothetical protein